MNLDNYLCLFQIWNLFFKLCLYVCIHFSCFCWSIPMLLQDLVPCILVTFEKEQIVMWRGKEYKPREDEQFFMERECFDDDESNEDKCPTDEIGDHQEFFSGDDDDD